MHDLLRHLNTISESGSLTYQSTNRRITTRGPLDTLELGATIAEEPDGTHYSKPSILRVRSAQAVDLNGELIVQKPTAGCYGGDTRERPPTTCNSKDSAPRDGV